MDLLIEECARDKVTGTSIAKQEATVLDANTVDAQQRIMNEGAVQLVVEADANILQNMDGDEIEMVEEDTVGQIVQGEDGEYYVVVDDAAPDVELDHLSSIQVVTNEDGSETLVLENDQPVTSSGGDSRNNTYTEDGQTQVSSNMRQSRTFYADTGDGRYEVLQMLDGDDAIDLASAPSASVGAITTAEGGDVFSMEGLLDPLPQGIKLRRNRVYGTCRCPECGQSFVNTARLERHLAVHQVFGSFLCPLCGKTYKYEYNLFYHWRRTCRDLNGLIALDERRTMDVGALRQVVEEVAQKKAEIGPIDIGINRKVLYATTPLDKLEMPSNTSVRRGNACRACGVIILPTHMPRHLDLHRGEGIIDERCAFGGFCCDLCGLLFRQHSNLIKHWRTGCPEIQANIPEDEEIILDDVGLKRMVMRLMKRPITEEAIVEAIRLCDAALTRALTQKVSHFKEGVHRMHSTGLKSGLSAQDAVGDRNVSQAANGVTNMAGRGRDGGNTGRMKEDEEFLDEIEERWVEEQGIVYADDFVDEEEAAMMGEEGAFGCAGLGGAQSRNKWSMSGGPVQCPECFRTFANSGRLERHMAGFHASFGTHHCILCGNRFKYDYNLLYHYRRSCPYTKAFIDRDIREQLDATNLRKLVRTLSQKDIQLAPSLLPPTRLLRHDPADALGSRRQMLRYPTPVNQPPPQLLVPRPGLQDAKSCPVCSVIFYGNGVIERHMKAAHPVEWEYSLNEGNNPDEAGRRDGVNIDELERYNVEDTEPPPTLTAEPPVQQPVVHSEPIVRRAHHIEVDDEGNQKLVDENGIVIEAAEGEEVHVEMDDLGDVQRLIDSGQLQVQHGDQIILVEGGDMDEFDEEIGERRRTTEYRIVRTEEAEIEEDNIVYEESLAMRSNSAGKRCHPARVIQEDADDGLEVAAILTEMKENERREAVIRARGDTAVHVSEGLQQVSRQDEEERDVKTGTEGMASLVNIPRPSLEASDAAIHSKAAHSTDEKFDESLSLKRKRSRVDSVTSDGGSATEQGELAAKVAVSKRRRTATEPSEAVATTPVRCSPRIAAAGRDTKMLTETHY
uniref:Zinc finger protein sdc-1 n=1 Tax=Ascaris suum TaxID=6253 RepID=F1KTL3_ASCSU